VESATPTFKIYPSEPLPSLFRELEAHVSLTGQPETFPGLHPGPLSPNEPFTNLGKIELDQQKRPDGDRAPCPMCHSPNKFKHGWFVYLPRLQAIAVIGNECASKDTRISANQKWRQRQALLTEESYLEAVLPQLTQWLAVLDLSVPVANELTALLSGFRSKGKPFFKALAPAKALGGSLVVTETITRTAGDGPRGMTTSGSNVETRDIHVGRIKGLKALEAKFSPIRELIAIRDLIVPHLKDGGEAILDYITGSDQQRTAAYRDLRKAEQLLRSFLADVEECRAFFTDANLAVIAEWASHPLAPHPFKLAIYPRSEGRKLLFHGFGILWNPIITTSFWEALPALEDRLK